MFPSVQIPQVSEAVDGQSVLVVDALICEPLDVTREAPPRLHVQVMPGNAAVNLDCSRNRLGDVLYRCHDRLTYGCCPRSPLYWTADRQSAANGGMEKCS
ncbi:MAG: hypothetical protein JO141_18800 [Bradyrhizobium sp.]|nr:hypothetical protein [Bradyrhizobium sp.]